MKKIIRLTESDLVKIVKRVISEQNDILSKKGYVLWDVNKLPLQQRKKVNQLMGEYQGYKYYTRKDGSSLISDGKQVYFIIAPQGWDKGFGPHDIMTIS